MKKPNLGTMLKNRRKSIKMTQFELSNKAGISQASISKIEAGKTEPGLIAGVKLMTVLKMKLDTLKEFI